MGKNPFYWKMNSQNYLSITPAVLLPEAFNFIKRKGIIEPFFSCKENSWIIESARL